MSALLPTDKTTSEERRKDLLNPVYRLNPVNRQRRITIMSVLECSSLPEFSNPIGVREFPDGYEVVTRE